MISDVRSFLVNDAEEGGWGRGIGVSIISLSCFVRLFATGRVANIV